MSRYSPRNLLDQEPAALAGAVLAILNLAVLLGLDLTVDQLAGINTGLVAVLSVFTRSRVTPVDGADGADGVEAA